MRVTLISIVLCGFYLVVMVMVNTLLGAEDVESEIQMQNKTIETVLKEQTERLMSLPGVVGTGQGECKGQPCITVFVVKKTPDLLKQIPSEIQGYEVVIQETGDIRALEPN